MENRAEGTKLLTIQMEDNRLTHTDLDIDLGDEYTGIEASVVGGLVRDVIRFLLGEKDELEFEDVDIVVSGVTPEEMVERGFTPVQADSFPVFIDTQGREAALARTERRDVETNEANPYKQFEVNAVSPDLSHKEALQIDLERRDLTVNAMAVNLKTGELVDPHNGLENLQNGTIKHVSEAFREDPLRVLRAARFVSRIEGAELHPETKELMKEIVAGDKLSQIPNERFRMEMMKVFKQSQHPSKFFRILREVNALEVTFPELHKLITVPAGPADSHKEGDSFEHTLLVVDEMAQIRPDDTVAQLAALVHDMGKGETPEDELPNHFEHSKTGLTVVENMAERLCMSNEQLDCMRSAVRQHMRLHHIEDMGVSSVLDLFLESSLSIDQLIALGMADSRGRKPQKDFPQEVAQNRLEIAQTVVDSISGSDSLKSRGLEPQDVGSEIPGERVKNLVRQDRIEQMRTIESC